MKKILISTLLCSPIVFGVNAPLICCSKSENKQVVIKLKTNDATKGHIDIENYSVNKGTIWWEVREILAAYVRPEEGCKFDGWYFGSQVIPDFYPIHSSFTATAKFSETPKTTITLQVGTGSGTVDSSYVAEKGKMWEDIKEDIKKCAHPAEDYTFKYWYNDPDTKQPIPNDCLVEEIGTAYAKFEEKPKVDIDLNVCTGGGGSIDPQHKTYRAWVGDEWSNVRETIDDYAIPDDDLFLSGWYSDQAGTNIIGDDSIVPDESFTAYAKFKEKEKIIINLRVYDDEGGSISHSSYSEAYVGEKWSNVSAVIDDYVTEDPGYTFTGWCDENGELIAANWPIPDVTFTAYAKFNEIPKVHIDLKVYDGKGGSIEPSSYNEAYVGEKWSNVSAVIDDYVTEDPAYTFIGWCDENGELIDGNWSVPDHYFIVYAKFNEKMKITIDLDVCSNLGGTIDPQHQHIEAYEGEKWKNIRTQIDKYAKPDPACVFIGWYSDEAGTTIIDDDSIVLDDGFTAYAKFGPYIGETTVLHLMTDEWAEITGQKIIFVPRYATWGSVQSLIKIKFIKGCELFGWFDQSGKLMDERTILDDENITVTAKCETPYQDTDKFYNYDKELQDWIEYENFESENNEIGWHSIEGSNYYGHYDRDKFDNRFYVGSAVTSIGDNFLCNCTSFNQMLTLPNTLTDIGDNFLKNCHTFDQPLTLPDALESIGNNFLSNCSNFNNTLTFPNGLETIGDSFLANCPLFDQEIILPDGLLEIGENFLRNCYNFNCSLKLPDSLNLKTGTTIGISFLYGCNNLSRPLDIQNLDPEKFEYDDRTLAATSNEAPLFMPGLIIKGINKNDFVLKFGYETAAWGAYRHLIPSED